MSSNEVLQVHVNELEPETTTDDIITDDPQVDEAEPEHPDTLLTNQAKRSRPTALPPGDIGRILTKCLMFSTRYHTTKSPLANPCPLLIEVPMIV
jgi:hypothetical protein